MESAQWNRLDQPFIAKVSGRRWHVGPVNQSGVDVGGHQETRATRTSSAALSRWLSVQTSAGRLWWKSRVLQPLTPSWDDCWLAREDTRLRPGTSTRVWSVPRVATALTGRESDPSSERPLHYGCCRGFLGVGGGGGDQAAVLCPKRVDTGQLSCSWDVLTQASSLDTG